MAYNFMAEWVEGSLNNAPDALSRNPVCDPEPTDILAERFEDGEEELSVARYVLFQVASRKVPACRFCVNVMWSTSSFSTMFETASLTVAICCQRDAGASGVFAATSPWMTA